MIERTRQKATEAGLEDRIEAEAVAIENLQDFASRRVAEGAPAFGGAYSNFASLNCVTDLSAAGRALSLLLGPGSRALLVVFGPWAPGEVVTLLLRGQPRAAFRRFSRGPVSARLGGQEFVVSYPRPAEFARAFAPWFRLRRVIGIGVFVPPSSAEPAISRCPRILSALETLDRVAARPLSRLGDHVLLDFERVA
jgi:hypothetical protein